MRVGLFVYAYDEVLVVLLEIVLRRPFRGDGVGLAVGGVGVLDRDSCGFFIVSSI